VLFDKNDLKIKRRLSRPRGFSLIEIMVAFVLALVAVLSLLGVFPSGITSIQESSDSVQAQAIGQAYLDYIREYYQTQGGVAAGFPASGTSFSCTPGAVQPLQFRSVTQSQMPFSCSYTYTSIGTGSTPEHRIDFTVSWSSTQRGSQSRTYEEYVIN
jgi:Tfp pilus assembly protein PilV